MKPSVLIVEDEQVLQDAYSLVLTMKGYRVRTADNGQEGLKELQTEAPHVVLLDLFMPVMNGKEFLKSIEPNDYPDTKIVVYSNLSDKETEIEVLNLGAHKFILKSSMAPRDLIELVRELTDQYSIDSAQ